MTTTNVYDFVSLTPNNFSSLFTETRRGVEILSGFPIGKNIQKVRIKVAKNGSPTGLAYVRVRDDLDVILGEASIDVTTLSTYPTLTTLSLDFGVQVTLGANYKVLLEYTDGDASNNVVYSMNNLTIPSDFSSIRYVAGYTSVDARTPVMTFDYDPTRIEIVPASAREGSTVTINGNGFGYNKAITVKFNGSIVTTIPAIITSDGIGTFTGTFVIPSLPLGVYVVNATDDTPNSADTNFEIITESINLVPSSGIVGTVVNVEGIGFVANELISFLYRGDPITADNAPVISDISGSFTGIITIPPSGQPPSFIEATDESLNTDSKVFDLQTNITLSSSSGRVGDIITITGNAFFEDETVSTTFGGDSITTIPPVPIVDSLGRFTATFVVPEKPEGSYSIICIDTNLAAAGFDFDIEPKLVLDPISGSVGSSVNIVGTGYSSFASFNVLFGNEEIIVLTVDTDVNGSFNDDFIVPDLPLGIHPVECGGEVKFFEITPSETLYIDKGRIKLKKSKIAISGEGSNP